MKFLYQRLLIKSSIVYFILGNLLGFFMFLGYEFKIFNFFFKLRSVHVHLLLLGFVIQMIMGVALWMFPRKALSDPEERLKLFKKEEKEGLFLYILFNSGTIIRTLFEGFVEIRFLYYFSLSGVLLQLVSILYLLTLIFPRIREPGR